MKIVFATHEGTPLYGGGPDVKIKALRKHLTDLGVEVQLFDLWHSREQLFDCDLVHLFGANFAVYNLARNLHYHNIKYVVNPIFYSRRSARTIRLINQIDRLTRRVLPGMWWEWGFTRDICQWAELVLPNTRDEGEILRLSCDIPQEKMMVIHNGVDARFLEASADLFEKTYGLRDFILHVGHMGPARKNVLNLVKALAGMDHPAVLIDRVMHTGETKQILQILDRHPHIRLIEGLPNDSALLASAYAACAVFALPSQFETPGRAALEAALAGAKIVITPYGGTREYFGDFATYVQPDNIEDIRKGIRQALTHPASDALPTHILEHFSWEKISRQTLAAYQRVLNR